MKDSLFGKTKAEIDRIVQELKMSTYSGNQILDWLYKKKIQSIAEMSNLSASNRERLENSFEFGLSKHSKVQESSDGTKKYLFPVIGQRYIEAAYIPEEDRATLCLSSQVGCKMGCLFCMTGKQGFQGNLSSGEILNQFRSLPEMDKVSNLVYMGMGEPMDNIESVISSIQILTAPWGYAMSPRRITVSTVGIIPSMIKFLDQTEAHLAISLHTPFDEERKKLMPVENAYPIREVVKQLKRYDWSRQRRISFEYIMFRQINDTPRHVNELTSLLNGIKCRINLIRFHTVPGSPLEGSSDETIINFQEKLQRKGIITTLRASRGQDIYAACGLLSTKELIKNLTINED